MRSGAEDGTLGGREETLSEAAGESFELMSDGQSVAEGGDCWSTDLVYGSQA